MIYHDNFQSLYEFAKQIKNDHAKGNKSIIIATAKIKYYWQNQEVEIVTEVHISLDRQPHSQLSLIQKDWLNAEDVYVEFQTGYNLFLYNEHTRTLTIECKGSSKIGAYKVELTEIS